jgi:hypothetical protein
LILTLVNAISGLGSTVSQIATFEPVEKVQAVVTQDGATFIVSVKSDVLAKTKIITFEALNDLHVQIDDFNFDGMKDFAVWQIDDGVGAYTIHRIFVYQSEAGFFKEMTPACGDDFANLRVERDKRVLLSTYWEMNEPKRCVTNLSPDSVARISSE